MTEELNETNEIAIELHNKKVTFTLVDTGENGFLFPINGKIQLMKNRIYSIPITTYRDLDDFYIVKVNNTFRESIDIRNVKDGRVSILPIVHGIILRHGDILGQLV